MGGARARNHSRKHRIGEDHRTKIAGERGLAKRRKRFKSNTVDPSVWAITKRFAPVITTPYELKRKLASLKAFYDREKNKPNLKGREIIWK